MIVSNKKNKTLAWDIAAGKIVRELDHASELVFSQTFSPNGKLLATGSNKGILRFWDVNTGQEKPKLPKQVGVIEQIVFSPDSKFLAAVGRDGTARVLDVASGRELRRLDKLPAIFSLAFSPDGRTLAMGNRDHTIRLWDMPTGKLRGTLLGHQSLVAALAFMADGKSLVSGSADSTVLCWDLSGKGRSNTKAAQPLSDNEFEVEWQHLQGQDPARSYVALKTLIGAPAKCLARLQKELRLQAPDEKMLAKWIAKLDDDEFAVRETASAELQKMGDLAWPALRKVLENSPSPEVRQRAKRLLDGEDGLLPYPQRLQLIRSLELLEWLDTPNANALVKTLADGMPGAWLTEEAKAIMQRRYLSSH